MTAYMRMEEVRNDELVVEHAVTDLVPTWLKQPEANL
jgi:hypothetical protein